jgi:YegS/Rv2252/BmrU family lipid kinase
MIGKTLFIINPASGIPAKQSQIGYLKAAIAKNPDYQLAETAYRGHATEIANQIKSEYQTIVAVGGDGTVNEVVSAIHDTDVTLGIIPNGSGNGLAYHLGIPMNWQEALAIIEHKAPKPIDLISINSRWIINVGGIGFDGHVAKIFNNTSSRGWFSYMKFILKELYSYQEFNFKLTTVDHHEHGQAFILAIANGSEFGNRFKVAAGALHDDGKFNLIIIRKPPFLKLLWLLLQGYQGRLKPSKYYRDYLLEKAELQFSDTIAHVDGEIDETVLTSPLRIGIKPSALKVYC